MSRVKKVAKKVVKKAHGNSKKTAETQNTMIELVASGRSMASVCKEFSVGVSTVWNWERADPSFAERVAHARKLGAQALMDECLDIADDGRNDFIERETDGGGYGLNTEHVQRSKLRIWTRMELAKKIDPAKHGDKIEHNVTINRADELRKRRERAGRE